MGVDGARAGEPWNAGTGSLDGYFILSCLYKHGAPSQRKDNRQYYSNFAPANESFSKTQIDKLDSQWCVYM
jgi:hypothetical protein